jgi:hypothetical protein
MSRRSIAVAAILVLTALSTALPASAADPARSRDGALPLEESGRLELRALFDRAPGVIAMDGSGVTSSAFAFEVIVARIGTDGKLVKACVTSEEEALEFLAAPIEKVQQAEGHQQ